MSRYSWLTVLVLVGGQAGFGQEAGEAPPAARVNGEPIAQADLDRVVAFFIQERFALTPPTPSQRRQVQQEVLTMLIDDMVMRQFLNQHAPKVEQAEIEKEINQLAQEQIKAGKTMADFYRESGQNESDVRMDFKAMLQWAGYVKNRIKPDVLKQYYETNKDFFDQVTVRASHILIVLPPDAEQADRQQGRDKLQSLRGDIAAGKIEFADAARKHSQCLASASNGGDIGYFPRKFMWAESFTQRAFDLKVGEVSDIVESPFGLHLIKVTDRKVGRRSDYRMIQDEVRDYYIEELRMKVLEEERTKAKIEVRTP